MVSLFLRGPRRDRLDCAALLYGRYDAVRESAARISKGSRMRRTMGRQWRALSTDCRSVASKYGPQSNSDPGGARRAEGVRVLAGLFYELRRTVRISQW